METYAGICALEKIMTGEGVQQWLFLQRTWAQSPGPTWWLTTIHYSSSKRSDAFP